jgi:hypothetical protein
MGIRYPGHQPAPFIPCMPEITRMIDAIQDKASGQHPWMEVNDAVTVRCVTNCVVLCLAALLCSPSQTRMGHLRYHTAQATRISSR